MRSFILYTSPNIIRVIRLSWMKWAGQVAHRGEMRNAYNILVGKPEWKKPLLRPWDRWEYNIRMDLREIEWEGVDWMHLAQLRDQWQALVDMVLNLDVP
jgi:hypothetical protein